MKYHYIQYFMGYELKIESNYPLIYSKKDKIFRVYNDEELDELYPDENNEDDFED